MGDQNRKIVFTILLGVLFGILVIQFFYLQIYLWDSYRQKSEQNRVRPLVLSPSRGLFFDRNGEILVENRPSFSVSVILSEMPNQNEVIGRLSTVLQTNSKELQATIKANQISRFVPTRIKRDLDYTTLCYLQEYKLDFPGVFHQVEAKRYYPAGVRAAHLFGYCAEISPQELERLKEYEYRQGDIIGKKGLEKQYEYLLRGEPGIKFVEVDALGREIRDLTGQGEKEAVPGKNLLLTLDAELQRRAETLIKDLNAVVIMVDARNGGVLVMASKPDYDPELFTSVLDKDAWINLISDPRKPLYDRALQSVYPPGSTYKLVVAAAALEERIATEEMTTFCPGYAMLGARPFLCWNKAGHGSVNMLSAIERSCNVYFYKLNFKVGIDFWAKYSRKFGFGKLTGIDLPAESGGLLPDRPYLDAHYGTGLWSKGMLFNLGVGQGDLLVTPLQMAQYVMIIANKGKYFTPHLLECYVDPSSNDTTWIQNSPATVEGITERTFNTIREGMRRVVNSGTGRGAWLAEAQVAGKTGTAQNPHGEDHAWFIGFAPFDDPQVAICVLVENGGGGGRVAAPIARETLKKYFELYSRSSTVPGVIAEAVSDE